MNLEFPTTAKVLGQCFNGLVVGNEGALVHTLVPLEEAREGSLSFLGNRKYLESLDRIRGGVLFTSPDLVRPELPLTYIVVSNPKAAFSEVAKIFRRSVSWTGISSQAVISETATLAKDVIIGPFTVIGNGARIGANTTLYPHVFVGSDVEIGEDCEIHPQVVLLDGIRIGNGVKIFSGSVIGSDGFGLMDSEHGMGRVEIPQIGTVVIEDNVRIGAKVTIDRATLGETRVGRGTKIDDQVHIGHNCIIGQNCIICAFAGLGGSCVLEDDVVLAGQVGLTDHVRVGKGARVGAQSGVSANLKAGETYFLSPAVPMKEALKMVRSSRRLPDILIRIKELEKILLEKRG